jgi:hypothetical protein
MAWEKLASVSGDGSSTTLSSGTIPAKKFLQFVISVDDFVSGKMIFNADTGSNYRRRYEANGAADVTNINQTGMEFLYDLAPSLMEGKIGNISGEEKLIIGDTSEAHGTTGAGNAPNRMQIAWKWTGTAQITQIDLTKTSNFSTACNLTIFGTD